MSNIPQLPFKMYVLDADNHVVEATLVEWGNFLESNRKFIAYTEITSECHVSTVFIGIDHRIYGKGPPVLFETMVFGGPLATSTWRYTSHDDAMTGHGMAVAKAREAIGQRVTE